MKHLLLLALALATATAASAATLDKVRISGTKKTLDRRESSAQARPRGQTTLTQKLVGYSFSLQRMSTDAPEKATVAWILIKEQKDGRTVEAARGESVLDLPLGRAITLDSAPVELEERDWTGRRNAGTVSSQLTGYGLRVLNSQGEVIAERYEPADLQRIITWEKPEEPVHKNIAELEEQIRKERQRQRALEQELK